MLAYVYTYTYAYTVVWCGERGGVEGLSIRDQSSQPASQPASKQASKQMQVLARTSKWLVSRMLRED